MQMKLSVSLAMVASATLFVPALCSAKTETIRVSVPFTFASTQLGVVAEDISTLVPKFDTSKGTLTKVTIRAFVRASGSMIGELTLTGNPNGWNSLVKVTANMTVKPAFGTPFDAPVEGTWRNTRFANYDHALDYKGASATTMNFSGSKMTVQSYTTANVLNAFKGAGMADISFTPTFSNQVQWLDTVPTNYQLPVKASMTGTIGLGVVYTYNPA